MSVGNTICWADIPVTDLDRAITFYTAVLGQPVTKDTIPGYGAFALLPHADQGASGCLVVTPDNPPSARGPLVYLNVAGRHDAAEAAVAAHGGTVVEPKHPIGPHGFRTVLHDSEGNRIALHSPPA